MQTPKSSRTVRTRLLTGRSRLLAVAAALVTALTAPALAPGVAGAQVAAEARPNTDPGFLQVYDANVENLPTSDEQPPAECAGDWHDLMYYMRTRELKPDLYLVQQLNNRAQLDLLLQRMEEHFGEKFAGVLAENDPEPTTGGDCNAFKKRQTNAVIWRTDRFSLVKSQSPDNRWQAQNHVDGACVNNDQPRTKGVKALLRDRVSGRTVTAASFHWPTMAHGGEECADENAVELSNELTEDGYDSHPQYGATDLYIAGGDTNAHDREGTGWREWYAMANGDLAGSTLGFRDAVYADCETTADPAACRKDRWTLLTRSHRRVDYLLARGPGDTLPRTTDAVVPTFDEGDLADEALSDDGDNRDLDYSDHRAVGARVHY
ncbi:hypothetical protein [Streptomyces luteolus]|uniref:Endonuclease/exonuclease/phosphatase domain-containing protein n=1 Tax=Streptomyces luteolus TaxID=3043615 RepID=A0ABT6SYH2_9ACTN|nr:hypothetical protein [Streptomyces sp. B-S-A12]MDI3420649.1 hypothetical protein [Streptomyces sp. B-S-A12]